MAVQVPYLSIDGDLNRAKRKLSGESLADEVWPQAGRSQSPLLPDPGKFNPAPAQPAPAATPGISPVAAGIAGLAGAGNRAADLAEGSVKLGAGVLGSPAALAIDTARQGIASARGTTLENPYAARDVTGRLMVEGVDGYGRAFEGAGELLDRAGAKLDQAIGARPRPASSASQPAIPSIASQPASAAQPGAATQAPQADQEGQWYMAGGGIAARVGQNGVPEFSNDATVVGSAQAMPAGGIGGQPLRRPGISNIADDVPLAQRGSISNIGNGIGGGISFGQAGDAANAIAQYEAANAIRREQLPGVRVAGTGYQNPMTAGQVAAQRQQDRREATRQELSLRERELGIQERRGIADDQVAQRNAQFEQQKLAQQGESSQTRLLGDLARAYGSMASRPQVELGDGKMRDVTFEEWARPMLGGIGAQVSVAPAGVSPESAAAEARAAIASGASREAVNKRLAEWGFSPV